MKFVFGFILFQLLLAPGINAQEATTKNKKVQAIYSLIDQYSLARERRDTVLLKNILMSDVDQLVSSGEWRMGIQASVRGMLQSSAGSPGTRTLTVEKVRFLHSKCALADAKYEIQIANGPPRKMWSTFVLVRDKGVWKISAIRNMLPTGGG